MDKLLSTQGFQVSENTSTTEAAASFPFETNSLILTPGAADCRVRFGAPMTATVSEWNTIFYDQSAGTYNELAEPSVGSPWNISGMTTSDRLYFAIDGKLIQAVEITMGSSNSNASVMSTRCSNYEANYLINLPDANLPQITLTDGTAAAGATFGQNGRLLFGLPSQTSCNTFSPSIVKGRIWYEIRVSAQLDASVTITGITLLKQHSLLTAGTTYTFDLRTKKVYHRTDSGNGTLLIKANY